MVWYFQRIATRLGLEREHDHLRRLDFGNADASSGLTTFWLGGSLEITPDEPLRFWQRLYADSLPVAKPAMKEVRAMLVQPEGSVVNAMGVHPFAQPWPRGTVVSAKTGSTSDRSGRGIRWLVGDVKLEGRDFQFVACVVGTPELAADAAVRLAEQGLRAAHVL